jgi:SAM-dependent methyltransferase
MKDDLQLWTESADAWINSQGERGDMSRQFLDPFVWEILGDVTGLSIADIGCGEGRFLRHLVDRGANAIGFEPVAPLREVAKSRGLEVHDCLAHSLPMKEPSEDWVIFYLVLIDLESIEAAMQEAYRVLKPGGKMLIVNLHPIATSTDEQFWERDAEGNKLARRVEAYGEPRGVVYSWSGITIRNYHRMLAQDFDSCLDAGFRLVKLIEPVPPAGQEFMKHDRMSPNFIIHVWQKPIDAGG